MTIDIRSMRKKIADKSSVTDTRSTTSIYYGHTAEIRLENKSEHAFNNVRLEYVIFYGQDINEHYARPGTLYHEQTINLRPKSKTQIKTEQVVLYTSASESEFGSTPTKSGRIKGIIVRLSYQDSEEGTVLREIAHPEGRALEWTTETRNAQLPYP